MKKWARLIADVSMLAQFGLSFLTPLLLCLAICYLITDRFGVGSWVYLPGFFFGLGGSFTVAYKMYRRVVFTEEKKKKDSSKESEKHRVCFNRHS